MSLNSKESVLAIKPVPSTNPVIRGIGCTLRRSSGKRWNRSSTSECSSRMRLSGWGRIQSNAWFAFDDYIVPRIKR